MFDAFHAITLSGYMIASITEDTRIFMALWVETAG